jgi:hypothetical protein
MSIVEASRLLDIPEHSIRQLAGSNRLPVRAFPDNDELVLDENELKSWAYVYRRYKLLQDEIERVSTPPTGEKNQGMALLS